MLNEEPPPPRYVLHVRSGKWRRQSQPSDRPVPRAPPLRNSLDHFLHSAMRSPSPDASPCVSAPDVLSVRQLDAFSARWSDAPPLPGDHPLVGLFGAVPLPDLRGALRAVWASPLTEVALRRVGARLVGARMVGAAYAGRMLDAFQPRPPLGADVFHFLVRRARHTRLDRNVCALFAAFDPRGTGRIAAATLDPRVLAAWAELRLFGKRRAEWEKMAAAMEAAGGIDADVAGDEALLSQETVRAVFCASWTLYTAMETVDMDGSRTPMTQ